MSTGSIRIKGLSHSYGATAVLKDIHLDVTPGEFVAIVGPSGSGKSTLLSLLSGYLKPTSGVLERTGTTRTVHQADGLYPWLTVEGNLALGLPKLDAASKRRAVSDMVGRIGLAGFEKAFPHALSGGMRQRVEIGRALCGGTDVLMLDEPFSALDYLTRLKMRGELCRLLEDQPRTVILVTHDIEEATQLADRVLVLSERPASIVYELKIDVPRPRDVTAPGVVDATKAVLKAMGYEP
ncbi:MAG: ABC transporter ATP-binding protein [Armatimonadaceae bacterium]